MSSSYVVPHHGFGAAQKLIVDGIDPEVFALLANANDDSFGARDVAVTLGRAPQSTGYNVYKDSQHIGSISADQTRDYAELEWIMDAGLSPEVTARLSLDEQGYPSTKVLLPPPGLCVPANNPPAVRWAMVEGSEGMEVHSIPTTLASYPTQDQHFLVSLRAKSFFGHRSVSAYVDGTFMGTLGHDDAHALADTIISYDHSGLVTVARGYYRYNDGNPRLTIYATPAAEPRRSFAVAAGTAATTGMVLSAAAVARAEAAIPMTGFFSAPALGAAGAAGAAATVSTIGTAGTAGTAATSASAGAGAGAASVSNIGAAGSTGSAGSAGAAASSGVGLQALAAASTAIIAVGGIGYAANNLYFNDAPTSTQIAAPSDNGSSAATADYKSGSASANRAGSPGAADADNSAGTADTADTAANANDANEAAARQQAGGTNAAGRANGASASGGGNARSGSNRADRRDTNAGLSLDELREAVRGGDNMVLARPQSPQAAQQGAPGARTTARGNDSLIEFSIPEATAAPTTTAAVTYFSPVPTTTQAAPAEPEAPYVSNTLRNETEEPTDQSGSELTDSTPDSPAARETTWNESAPIVVSSDTSDTSEEPKATEASPTAEPTAEPTAVTTPAQPAVTSAVEPAVTTAQQPAVTAEKQPAEPEATTSAPFEWVEETPTLNPDGSRPTVTVTYTADSTEGTRAEWVDHNVVTVTTTVTPEPTPTTSVHNTAKSTAKSAPATSSIMSTITKAISSAINALAGVESKSETTPTVTPETSPSTAPSTAPETTVEITIKPVLITDTSHTVSPREEIY